MSNCSSHPQSSGIIEVEGVSKRYGETTILDDISFTVTPGEAVGILGPNGAGKTTLFEIIEGIRQPDAGGVRLAGFSVRRRKQAAIWRQVGVMLQPTEFESKLKAGEILKLFATLHGIDSRKLPIDHWLEDCQHTSWKELSAGEKQRLALAAAAIHRPPLLLLDEPTANLDVQSRLELRNRLLHLKNRGTSLLLASHYLEEAEQICDRVIILQQGRIIFSGTIQELRDSSPCADQAVLRFSSSLNAEHVAILSILGIVSSPGDREIVFTLTDFPGGLATLAAAFQGQLPDIEMFSKHPGTLESAFLSLIPPNRRDPHVR